MTTLQKQFSFKKWIFFVGVPLVAFAILWGLRQTNIDSGSQAGADRQITSEESVSTPPPSGP